MKIPRINCHQLITFYLVAKEQGFTAASEKLSLSEPAVHQQVRALEISVGVKLVYVKKKRVHLTEVGQTLLRYAEKLYEQAKSADTFLEEIRKNSLRVGVAATFSGIVSSAAAQFEKILPNKNLSIKNGPSHRIVSQLLDLQYDVAIVISADYHTNKLTAIKLSEGERLLFTTNWSTPIGANDSLNLADLADCKFLLPPYGSAIRQIMLDMAKAEGLELHFVEVETDFPHYIKMLTEMKKGIALLPEAEARLAVSEKKLRVLNFANEIRVTVDALVLKDFPRNEILEEFIKLAKQAFDASHTGALSIANDPVSRALHDSRN
jgi:DNA-binding transcriptional LysR family regulator